MALLSQKGGMYEMRHYLAVSRPHHWVKNLTIFLPLFFASKLFDDEALLACTTAFAAFCILSSAVYVFNDIQDAHSDRQHPTKRRRPVATGNIPTRNAVVFGSVLAGLAMLFFPFLKGGTVLALAMYLLINIAYSIKLKHIAVIDVICVAAGFVLRILAGAMEAGVEPSRWIILMTFLLAVSLVLAKRRDDLLLAGHGTPMRKSLEGYTSKGVSLFIILTAVTAGVSYVLYTYSEPAAQRYGTGNLMVTTVLVFMGILRYLQITFTRQASGSPTRVLFQDRFLQAVLGGWAASFFCIIYFHGRFP